jgi:hypothetical protein
MMWLKRTVNVLHTFSTSGVLGEGFGLVILHSCSPRRPSLGSRPPASQVAGQRSCGLERARISVMPTPGRRKRKLVNLGAPPSWSM